MENKKSILRKQIEEHNIEISEVLDKIEVPLDDKTGVFFYTSYFEGLGTKSSDIDLYVISDHILPRALPGKYLSCDGVITFKIKGLEFDVEYWSEIEIKRIIDECKKNHFIESDLLKLLLRLHYGYSPINNWMAQTILQRLKNLDVEKCVTEKYALISRSSYDDAVKLFQAEEYILSIDCCRRALWDAVTALNSANGHSNLKEKWISKIFIDNNAYGDTELLNKYYEFQVFPVVSQKHFEKYVEEFLEVVQEFISKISFLEAGRK